MDNFRKYELGNKVQLTYQEMQQKQTLPYVLSMKSRKLGIKMSVWAAMDRLNEIVDESDPDTDLPQIIHAYQTGEALSTGLDTPINTVFTPLEYQYLKATSKEKYIPIFDLRPTTTLREMYSHITDWDWLPLVGFIHDLGKVLVLPEFGSLPQWSVVGDTFPVGYPFSKNNVYYEQQYYMKNPDLIENTGNYGIHCGFDQVHFSFGHDEFLAHTLEMNTINLPSEAVYIIRYHSFYPWHRYGNYSELANYHDWHMLPLLKFLQKSDLYSKSSDIPEIDYTKYQHLIKKYLPETLTWG